MPSFPGFSPETLTFLADLAANNDRAWFEAHKDTYTDVLLPEAQAFISALGAALRRFAPELLYDTRTNGQGSLLRIYRDIRFSADKTPYHTYLRMVFWQGEGKKTDNPAFLRQPAGRRRQRVCGRVAVLPRGAGRLPRRRGR